MKQIYKKYGVKHAISFHTSIKAADSFREQQDVLNCLQPQAENFHISSHKSAGERKLLLDEFKRSPRALMTNARCLTEGIDVPAIDCVVFADPKQSTTDVVQASGRAMRRVDGKKYGYIVVPIVVPEGMEFDEFAETTAFKTIVRIITALSVHDTRIVDELRAIHHGRISKGKIIKIDGKVPVGMRMSLDRFAEAVSTKLWKGVARANWLPFEEARAFVHKLKLKSFLRDWLAYCRSKKKPNDIPANPASVYAKSGWISWGDWLGNGQRKGGWRNFEEARAFVQDLGLKSTTGWSAYCRSGQKPDDIPAYPRSVYAESGWKGIGDWLGTGNRYRGDWRNFKEARAFVQSLGFKSGKDWHSYCRSGQRPNDIPANPHVVYANSGWIRMSDWLGNGQRKGDWRNFEEARAFVQDLGLKSGKQWSAYCRSGKKPDDIPASPDSVYAKSSWISMGDWLGTGNRKGDWRNFEEARAFMQNLGLNSGKQWAAYCRSGQKPNDIPAAADRVYAECGWNGWNDFLGTGNRDRGDWRNFVEARAFVQNLGLESETDWRKYCRSGQKPDDIPAAPDRTYAESGWVDWGDWLGTGNRSGGNWRSFEEARAFVQSLGIKSETEWREYRRSGQKPDDIPANPDRSYANSGWIDWGDWLGTGRRKSGSGLRPL